MYLRLTVLCLAASVLIAQSPLRTMLFDANSTEPGAVTAVAADRSGNVFAAGYAASGAFVAKINSDFRLTFVATLPGRIPQASALALDSAGNAYVTGAVSSQFVAAGSVAPTIIGCNGNCQDDAYVAKVNGETGRVEFVTYLGGQSADTGTAIAVAPDSTIYAAGTTGSGDFPVTAGALLVQRPTARPGFVARLSADGKSLLSATYWNGAPPRCHWPPPAGSC